MRTRIASIHFATVKAERSMYGGYYEIAAVKRGVAPTIIVITDRIQRSQGPYALTDGTKRSVLKHEVRGEEIARDIVAAWTEYGLGCNPTCHPGIWVVRDWLPELNENGTPIIDEDGRPVWRDATEKERTQMFREDETAARSADAAYAEMLFMRANIESEDVRKRPLIPEIAKIAARHYGHEFEWMKTITSSDITACPECTKTIPASAIKCPFCQGVVDIARHAAREAEVSAAIALAMAAKSTEPPKIMPTGKGKGMGYAEPVHAGV